MPTSFTLTIDPRVSASEVDEVELNGEDISLRGGEMFESTGRDISTVVGVSAARQSVLRELAANPGSFPRRPEWGGGLAGMLFKGATGPVRDRIQSRAKSRLFANPRIVKVREVSTAVTADGITLTVRCDALGGFIEETTFIRPPGV